MILSHDASPAAIVAALRDALLTDDELAEGEAAWRRYPDPFSDWRAEPEDVPMLDNRKEIA